MRLESEHVSMSELELLSRNRELRTSDEDWRAAEIRVHLSSCADCAGAADMHDSLMRAKEEGKLGGNRTCPPSQVWFELAGGLLSPEESARLLAHAAECSDCSTARREAQEDLDGPENDVEVGRLQSSTAGWQDTMARRLAWESHQDDVRIAAKSGRILRFPDRLRWMSAIAAILLLGIGWIGWRTYRASSDDALLAQAYDVQRRTELRLRGGKAVPLASMNRGSSDKPPPTQLLKLRLRAQEHLDRDPNNAYWHVVLGRIALVENNGERAKQELQTALTLNSTMSGVKADLAAAYFEIGEGTGDQASFARAADLYGELLDHPSEAPTPESLGVWHFNRALSWDRQSVYHEAIQDYEQALKLERDSGWRQETERRLKADADLEKKSETGSDATFDRSPGAFLHRAKYQQPSDDDYEFYLAEATRDWLPRAGSSVEMDAALHGLAAQGIKRHDTWVADILLAAKNPVSREAADHLSHAVEANARGNADAALSESTAALKLFSSVGNRAGALRAEVEQSYSFARQGHANDCIAIADPLLQSRALEPYVWLHVYLLLNRATCSGATGDVQTFMQQTQEGMRIAREASLPMHILRAEGFLVEGSNALGDKQTAWRLAQQGLRECADGRGTRMASYQFLESIYTAVTDSMPYAAAGVADAAAHAASLVPNVQIQAYAFELQGKAETAIFHETRAGHLFEQASTLLRSAPQGRAAKLYEADWEADRAEWLAQSGRVPEALHRLGDADNAVADTDNYAVRQVHHTEFARLLLMSGDAAAALTHATAATQDAEHALATTSGEPERLAWERTNGRGYRLLVQGLASKQDAGSALQAWEWYRAAPYRHPQSEIAGTRPSDTLPWRTQFAPGRLRTLTLIVGRLENEYVVWSVDGGPDHGIRMMRVAGSPQQLEETARTLTELCADRNSSEQSIRVVGRELYKQLFGSFRQQLEQVDAVQLDLDRSLQYLPIASLVQSDGRYLGLAHSLTILPAWWSVMPPAQQTLPASPQVLLVEGRSTGQATSEGSRAVLPEEYLETRYLETVFPGANVMRSSQTSTAEIARLLPEVEVFHYSGHTMQATRRSALLLGASGDSLDAKAIGRMSLPRLKLAVLATCSSTGNLEAGVNDPDSITHALLRAGAANVMSTLWDVDTQSFRDLMVRLYEGLRRDDGTIAHSLKLAQTLIQANVLTAHPFYWASIQLFTQ